MNATSTADAVVCQVVCRRTCLLELRVRDDVGGWDW